MPETSAALPPVKELHALSLANHLVTLYATRCITDISVRCGDETFDLHSPVLSHGSDYFRNVFADDQSEITLEFTPSIESSTFRIIVESLYTGTVDGMTERNVTSVLEASHHMGINLVTDACEDFMLKHLDFDNCLEYWLSAKLCDNSKVRDEAIGLMGRHLDNISQVPKFLNLQSNTIIDIFADNKLQVASEVMVYEAAMAWIKYDPESREKELSSVLESIRLPLLPKRYLVNVVGKEDMIEENSDAMKKYSMALKSQLGGESKRVNARHNPMHGMRGGYEKMSKSIRHSIIMPQRPNTFARGVFSKCCDPEDEGPNHDRFEEFRSNVSSGVQNIGSGAQDGAKKLGEGVQGALLGLGKSLKKVGESITDPETYNNLEKRNVGGFWLDVTDDVNKQGIDTIQEGNEVEEQEANDYFELSTDDDANILQQSVSVGDPLDEVPEVNEDDLSQVDSFDMDGLSEDDKKEEQVDNNRADGEKQEMDGGLDKHESRVIGEDFLDLLNDPPSLSKTQSEDIDLLDDDGDERYENGIIFAA